jgi:pimeloyl-ACP methyl ester carboxylesterase
VSSPVRRLLALLLVVAGAVLGVSGGTASGRGRSVDPAVVSVFPVPHAQGVLATSGGWAYCEQVKALARRFHYTLVCGRYYQDGYTGYGLRSQRRLDWGDPAYLASLAEKIQAVHRRVGGELVLLGVSYSGFGVATLASHHPELRPGRLIVIDSFLDLPARREAAGSNATGREIDQVTGGSAETLASRSVSVSGLASLVRDGSQLTVIWSVAPGELREFNGATCNSDANAAILAKVATTLGRPVTAWVTQSKHGHDLWDSGRRIMNGRPPGKKMFFLPGGGLPPGSTCS